MEYRAFLVLKKYSEEQLNPRSTYSDATQLYIDFYDIYDSLYPLE